jgi:hypothetical protein
MRVVKRRVKKAWGSPVEWSAKAEGSHAKRAKKTRHRRNSNPQSSPPESDALPLGHGLKALLAMQWQEDGLLTPFLSAQLPKSNKVFCKMEY